MSYALRRRRVSAAGEAVLLPSYDDTYVRALAEIIEEVVGVRALRTDDPASACNQVRNCALHLQWIDVVLRHRSVTAVLRHAVKLLALLMLLRFKGCGVVWTYHNSVGKGHGRRRLDRVLRTAVAHLSNAIVVHDTSTVDVVRCEILCGRSRVVRRTVVVPMPYLGEAHETGLSKASARETIGLTPEGKPVVAYFSAANQPDIEGLLTSPAYELLVRDRATRGPGRLARSAFGWTWTGECSDTEFGLLLAAADAVVLGDEHALGSKMAHAAVAARTPVISPSCPAVAEMASLGLAITFEGPPTPEKVRSALGRLHKCRPEDFDHFVRAHSPSVVGSSLAQAYLRAGVQGGPVGE